jgi:hypothetical protein
LTLLIFVGVHHSGLTPDPLSFEPLNDWGFSTLNLLPIQFKFDFYGLSD